MEWYWNLVLKDGTSIEIPPSFVPVVQKRMANKDAINLKTRSIPYSEIKGFEQSEKPFSQQPLLSEVAQAFNEPVVNPDGSIACQWVKKHVTQDRWNKYYSASGSYKKLGDEGGMVIMAWFQPIHSIDVNKMTICNETETQTLERTRNQR